MGDRKKPQNEEQNQQKKLYKSYDCDLCSYSTRNKKDYKRHCKTKKHIKNELYVSLESPKICHFVSPKNPKKKWKFNGMHICNGCGKFYKHASSLCKHKKTCNKIPEEINDTEKIKENNNDIFTKKDEMMEMMKLFAETTKKQNEIIEKLAEKNQINNTYNNCSTNNKMTINLFLNDTCKNAMNLTDFVKNIEVSLEDLEFTSQNGFRKGINNIINKQLQDLQPTERPFHCSDSKRLQFYVKEDDKWEKDVQNKKIDKSIHDVKMKQIEKLFEWQDAHPNYRDNKSLDNHWHEMVKEIMGGSNVKEQHKFAEKLKKSLFVF